LIVVFVSGVMPYAVQGMIAWVKLTSVFVVVRVWLC